MILSHSEHFENTKGAAVSLATPCEQEDKWLRGPATPRSRHLLILPYRFELIPEMAA